MLSKEQSPFTQKNHNSFFMDCNSEKANSKLSFDTSLVKVFVQKKNKLPIKTSDFKQSNTSDKMLEDMVNLTLDENDQKDSFRQKASTDSLVRWVHSFSHSLVYLELDLEKRNSKPSSVVILSGIPFTPSILLGFRNRISEVKANLFRFLEQNTIFATTFIIYFSTE